MANRRFHFLLLPFLGVLLSLNTCVAQFTRGTQMKFGKNRVQYTDFLWTYNRFTNFDTYFYVGGQDLAVYTGRTADKEIDEIEKLFDYRIDGRFEFIIYNKLSDLKQTNIGLEGEEQSSNTGGLTHINGTKVLLYFDGDYRHLREQIRAGVAQVMINQLMYGGSIKNRVQSAVLLNIPDWYLHGLVNYVAKGWSTDDDNKMRDGILSGRIKKFNNIASVDPDFAGQSLWNYIIENYGSTSVSNLLYMTRINRNIESGFIYVIGASLSELSRNWLDYYKRGYADDDKNRTTPLGKPVFISKKSNRIINQVKVSPDGTQIAYVTNDMGKYKVWLYDTRKNKRKKLAKGGYKSANQPVDNSFPVLAWHPTGRYLTAIKEKKGKLWMDYYTPRKWGVKREKNKFFYFEKVLDFSYSASGSEIAMSAVQKGQSDIYTFNIRTKTYQQITKDRWDDSNAHYVMGDRYIAFSSTRPEDSLKNTSFRQKLDLTTPQQSDLYLYNTISKSPLLLRLTNTPAVNETEPMMIDSSHFAYLSNANGITNRYLASLDSTISYIDTVIHYRYIVIALPQTNYQRNIITQDVNSHQSKLAELIKNKNRYELYLHPIADVDSTYKSPLTKTNLRFKIDRTTALPAPKVIRQDPTITLPEPVKTFEEQKQNPTPAVDSNKIDINNYQFQSEFPTKKKKQNIPAPPAEKQHITNSEDVYAVAADTISKTAKPSDSAFYQVPKQRNYDPTFSVNYLVTQVDNSLLNETYQTYTGGAVYFDPGLNLLLMLGVNDLMDDYKITGGFRLSGNLNSNEYYMSYENLKHRIDRQLTFYRQSREEVTDASLLKIQTHEVKYSLKNPFSDVASLRGSLAYRNDRTVDASTDLQNLKVPNVYDNWVSARLEYVFDNTINTGLNLYNGLRFKIFAESYRQIIEDKNTLHVLGADFRYYIKVHRQIIWANRFAASTTFGTSKLIYYLGSTDNALSPTNNFNTNIQVDPKQNYAFQAVATNLRGFTQNIRNGSSFALINSEIRVPIFQYLINKPIRSDFFRNFQVIGFADVGSAWNGSSPYNKNNALYKASYPGNPISIDVTKTVEPIVGGYGIGLRTRILGYFIRTDWAWGVDDGVVQPRIFYFSLGLDF